MEPKKLVLGAGILYSILITIAFLLPSGGKLNQFDFIIPIDKLLHLIIHLILVFIWLHVAFHYKNQMLNYKFMLLTMLCCIGYGIIIEIIQGQLIESRKSDFMDVIANSTGTLLGFFIFLKVKFRFNS